MKEIIREKKKREIKEKIEEIMEIEKQILRMNNVIEIENKIMRIEQIRKTIKTIEIELINDTLNKYQN